MVRDTSLEAYNFIKENGLLSKMRWICYDLLFKYGPATANQLMDFAKKENPSWSHQTIETVGRRLSELVKVGVVYEKDKIFCPISGHRCIEWEVTRNKPIDFEKPLKKKCKACNGTGFIVEQQSKFRI